MKKLAARLIERAIEAEMTEHIGYERHAPEGRGLANFRNGVRTKTLKTDQGPVEIEVPRDRASTFEPQFVNKGQTHFTGFDEKILALYARGMTVRDIQGRLEEMYGVHVSPDLISRATSTVMEDVIAGLSRPLDALWRFRLLCEWNKSPGRSSAILAILPGPRGWRRLDGSAERVPVPHRRESPRTGPKWPSG